VQYTAPLLLHNTKRCRHTCYVPCNTKLSITTHSTTTKGTLAVYQCTPLQLTSSAKCKYLKKRTVYTSRSISLLRLRLYKQAIRGHTKHTMTSAYSAHIHAGQYTAVPPRLTVSFGCLSFTDCPLAPVPFGSSQICFIVQSDSSVLQGLVLASFC
jgi:hypothetical protein